MAYTSTSLFIVEGSQDRSLEAGADAEAMKGAADWLALRDLGDTDLGITHQVSETTSPLKHPRSISRSTERECELHHWVPGEHGTPLLASQGTWILTASFMGNRSSLLGSWRTWNANVHTAL